MDRAATTMGSPGRLRQPWVLLLLGLVLVSCERTAPSASGGPGADDAERAYPRPEEAVSAPHDSSLWAEVLPAELLPVTVLDTLAVGEPPFPESREPLWRATARGLVGASGEVLPGRRWRGRVVDADGQLVEGARVRVLPNGATQLALGLQPHPFREFIGLGWSSYLLDADTLERLPDTTTDASGRFTLEAPDLPMDQDYGLFKLGRPEPIVHAEGDGLVGQHALTADERAAGDVELEMHIDVARRSAPVDEPVATLRGRVVDEQGRPLPGIAVRARRSDVGLVFGNTCSVSMTTPGPHTLLMTWRDAQGTVRTDARGEFELAYPLRDSWAPVGRSLDPGALRYDVIAHRPGWSPALVVGVAPDEDTELVLRPAARLHVDVVAAETGAPLPITGLRAYAHTGLQDELEPLVCLPRQDDGEPRAVAWPSGPGYASWEVHAAGQLANRLVLDLADRTTSVVTTAGVPLGLLGRVTVEVHAPRALTVEVRGVDGAALPRALVVARCHAPGTSRDGDVLGRVAADGEGLAHFQRLPGRDVLLEVSAAGHGRGYQLAGPAERQRVELQSVGRLLVSFEGGDQGLTVSVEQAATAPGLPVQRLSLRTDRRGRARFELAPGPWSVQAGRWNAQVTIDPAGEHELDFGPWR